VLQKADDNFGDRPRLLFLDHTAALGGGEIALLRLVEAIDRRRYEPVVVLFSDGPLVSKLRESNIECHILPLSNDVIQTRKDGLGIASLLQIGAVFSAVGFLISLAQLIRCLDVQIVHTNSLKSDLLGGIAARLAHRPVIWHVRDRISSDYLPPAVASVFRELCRLIPDRVVTNSHATMRTLGPNPPSRYKVVHDGTVVPAEAPPLGTSPRIGLVGRIAPWKGQDVFLLAAARLREKFPQAKFLIIGSALFKESEFEAHLHKLSADLHLADTVEFTGFRDDISEAMSSLTMLVHASTTPEPFGQVVIEAMALAKPVIATNGGGIPEIIEHGRSGMLVPLADDQAMADAISRLLSNPAQAAEMGRLGRQRVSEFFTIQRTAAQMEQVFAELQSEKSGHPQPRLPHASATPVPSTP
jgi:glycosyltransferase involved in cell wall biosynthesis